MKFMQGIKVHDSQLEDESKPFLVTKEHGNIIQLKPNSGTKIFDSNLTNIESRFHKHGDAEVREGPAQGTRRLLRMLGSEDITAL